MSTPEARWMTTATDTTKRMIRVGNNPPELREELLALTDDEAQAGLALLAVWYARITNGDLRLLPDKGIADLVLSAADEGGLAEAIRTVDAFSDLDVRVALGNLAVWSARHFHHQRIALEAGVSN